MTNTEADPVARRYEAVFDNPMTLIGLLEPDGTVLDANRTALDLVDASASEVTGRKFWNTPWWEGSEALQGDLRDWVARAADGEYVRYETDHPTRDGDAITVDGVVHPVRDDDGDVAELLAVAREVSDREDRERTLAALHDLAVDLEAGRSAEEVCQRTVDGAHRVLDFDLCVINLREDRQLPVVATSDPLPEGGAATMSVDEGVAGKTYRTGESMLVDDARTVDAAKPQGPYRAAISVPVGDHGVFQVVEEDVGAFEESDLELAELLASHTAAALDRLDRERQLERENERLEEFVSVLSHDLRNPLNVLVGAIDEAEATGDPDAFDDCRWAADRMEGLIEDLLTLAREGRVVDEPDDVALADVVEACWRSVATESMTLAVETDLVVRADRERL
jgi:two-component system OmpR family sensor kinase